MKNTNSKFTLVSGFKGYLTRCWFQQSENFPLHPLHCPHLQPFVPLLLLSPASQTSWDLQPLRVCFNISCLVRVKMKTLWHWSGAADVMGGCFRQSAWLSKYNFPPFLGTHYLYVFVCIFNSFNFRGVFRNLTQILRKHKTKMYISEYIILRAAK